MTSTDRQPRRPRRRWIWVALAGAVGVTGAGVIAAAVLNRSFPSCDWTQDEIGQVEAVPLKDFLGVEAGGWAAICDSSAPDYLYIVDRLPDGDSLPNGWFERDRVGSWTAQWRFGGNETVGPLVCYSSSDARYPSVEVRLWASGTVEASIVARKPPCADRP